MSPERAQRIRDEDCMPSLSSVASKPAPIGARSDAGDFPERLAEALLGFEAAAFGDIDERQAGFLEQLHRAADSLAPKPFERREPRALSEPAQERPLAQAGVPGEFPDLDGFGQHFAGPF